MKPFLRILSEICIIIIVCVISLQASSLVSSILLVPSRVALMLIININHVSSGILCYIFIIVFIGGLIVLLVRVSSTVQQEQGIFPSLLASLVFFFGLLSYTFMDWSLGRDSLETTINMINLIWFYKVILVISMLLLLILCLFILTKLLLDFKGITRNF